MDLNKLHALFLESTGISTDTRTIKKGDLFIALSGENFDGNTFVPAAINAGASYVVCTDPAYENHKTVIVVEDSLITLQQLATFHRQYLKTPIVALTGSNGKTTTKELILSVLSQKHRAVGTKGNLNNHIGVPLTLLSFDRHTAIGVVEMGANHLKEIENLCHIALPDYGLITNFGKAHMEGFGGIEGIKKGKSELYDFLKRTNGKAIVLAKDPEQLSRTETIERRISPQFEVNSSQPIHFKWDHLEIETQLTGSYNIANMELAAAVGLEFDLTPDQISKGLAAYRPENNRSQIIRRHGFTIIMDAYNANPSSMKVALENLAQLPGQQIAILGDMFELGKHAREEHQTIADLAAQLGIDQIHLIGEHFNSIESAQAKCFKGFDEFQTFAKNLKFERGSTVLVKGSRGMALERVLELIVPNKKLAK